MRQVSLWLSLSLFFQCAFSLDTLLSNGAFANSFNVSDAETFVLYSYSSYCHMNRILDWNCNFCKEDTLGFKVLHYSYHPATDSAAFVGYHPNRREIVLSFRGTDPLSIKNWMDDLVYFKTSSRSVPDAKVHAGFQDAYFAHAEDVLSTVLGLIELHPEFDIVATGHSLGGALATVCAMDLHYVHNITNIKVITFGSPRVGDELFSSYFSKAFGDVSWRVVHKADIVPHLPLKSMGFKHVPREIWERHQKKFLVCDDSGEDPLCSDGKPFAWSIPDHLHYMGKWYVSCWLW